jgi:hypothetical protein
MPAIPILQSKRELYRDNLHQSATIGLLQKELEVLRSEAKELRSCAKDQFKRIEKLETDLNRHITVIQRNGSISSSCVRELPVYPELTVFILR